MLNERHRGERDARSLQPRSTDRATGATRGDSVLGPWVITLTDAHTRMVHLLGVSWGEPTVITLVVSALVLDDPADHAEEA